MGFTAEHFFKELTAKQSKVFEHVMKLEFAWQYEGDNYDEELHYHRVLLEHGTDGLYCATLVALEALGLHEARKSLVTDFAKYCGNLLALEYVPYIGIETSPALECLGKYIDAIGAGLDSAVVQPANDEAERKKLESILSATPTIVRDRKLKPEAEADVRKAIYDILKITFPKTVRDFAIGHPLKSFKPDFGLPDLSTAIEYKYAATEGEIKTNVEGLCADMIGYDGSNDWQWFYAVIYQCEPFVTQSQVDAQFEKQQANGKWKCILVSGDGTRNKRSRATPRKPAPAKSRTKKSSNSPKSHK